MLEEAQDLRFTCRQPFLKMPRRVGFTQPTERPTDREKELWGTSCRCHLVSRPPAPPRAHMCASTLPSQMAGLCNQESHSGCGQCLVSAPWEQLLSRVGTRHPDRCHQAMPGAWQDVVMTPSLLWTMRDPAGL